MDKPDFQERYREGVEGVLKGFLSLDIDGQKAEELIQATRQTLSWEEQEFEAARRVVEKIATTSPKVSVRSAAELLYSGHMPPTPFQEFERDIPLTFRDRTIPITILSPQERRIAAIQEIVRNWKKYVDIIVDENGIRELMKIDSESRKPRIQHSLDGVLQHPNVQWGVRPPKDFTEPDDSFFTLPHGVTVQFSKSSNIKDQKVIHGDETYTIQTGDVAKEGLEDKRELHRKLRKDGRGNEYLRFIINYLN